MGDHGFLPDGDEHDAGVADPREEVLQHVVPGAAVLQLHQLFLLAVHENAPAVVCIFRDVTQHVHGLFLVGHVRLLDQASQVFPGGHVVMPGNDTVRERHTPAHVIFQSPAAFFRQPAVDGDGTLGRSRGAERDFDEIECPVIFNILQERYYFRQTPGIILVRRVQCSITGTEYYTNFLPVLLPERLTNASEQYEY